MSDAIKQSLYLGDLWLEIELEALRTDRTPAYLLRRAWKIACDEIRKLPTVDQLFADEDTLVEDRGAA